MNLMPAVVKSESMDLLTGMPMSSGIAVQDGAVVRPEGPQTLWCSQEKGAPPTSWTILCIRHARAPRTNINDQTFA